jgi:hypothetical protein
MLSPFDFFLKLIELLAALFSCPSDGFFDRPKLLGGSRAIRPEQGKVFDEATLDVCGRCSGLNWTFSGVDPDSVVAYNL